MSKQTKVTAREVAAPKVQAPRAEFVEMAASISNQVQTLSALLYNVAMRCRELKATAEEIKLVLDAAPKQRRADFKTVVAAPDGAITKGAPKNLAKLAQFIRARNKGADAATAKRFAEQKIDAAGLRAALGQEEPAPTAGKAGKPVGTTDHPIGNDAFGDLEKHARGVVSAAEVLKREYADRPAALEILAAMIDMVDLLDDLKDATAA